MQTAMASPCCTGRGHGAGTTSARCPLQPCLNSRTRGVQQVVRAITKEKKATIVAELQSKLQNSMLVYGWRYESVAVKDMEAMRRELPEGSSMLVTKNRLLRVAIDTMEDADMKERWSTLKGQKGMNAYVFVEEQSIRDAVKAYGSLYKKLKDKLPDAKPGRPPVDEPLGVKCCVMDGQTVDVNDFKSLEKIPTKTELLTKIAVGLKANPTKIARGLNAVPLKIAYALNAIGELSDDKAMTVEAAAAAAKEAAPSGEGDAAASAEDTS